MKGVRHRERKRAITTASTPSFDPFVLPSLIEHNKSKPAKDMHPDTNNDPLRLSGDENVNEKEKQIEIVYVYAKSQSHRQN